VTRRDTYILAAVAVVGVMAAFWMLALAPKRKELSSLDKDIATAQQSLDQAKQEKVKFAGDQVAFPRLYASLGRLGKAVPPDEDVPSLLVQLNHAAAKADVNFHAVELKPDLAEKIEQAAADAAQSASSATATATPPAEGAAAGATGAQGAQASGGSAAPAGQAGAAPAGGAAAPAAPAGGAASASASSSAAAPAAGTTSSPGAPDPAAAAFKVLPFEYKFRGDFFKLEELIHNMTRLVERRNQELAVTGRLITIQGFALKRGQITVLATTYMLPADQGLFAGATPQGPAGAATPQAAAAGATPPAPPTAAVTSP
jgi:hypothetical protein